MGVFYTINAKYNVTGDCYKSNGVSNITQPNSSGANGSFTTNWLCNCWASWVKKWSEAYVEITVSPPAGMASLSSISIKYRYKYENDVSGNWESPEIKTGYINTSGGYEYKNTRNGDLSSGSFSSYFTDTISSPPLHSDGKYHLAIHCQNRQDVSALKYVKVEISEITMSYTLQQISYRFLSDGSVISSGTVAYNSIPPTPANPTKDGYTFSGWDKTVGAITSATDYNAVWNANTYYIAYSANGGSGSMYTMSCYYGTEYTLSSCTFTAPTVTLTFAESTVTAETKSKTFSHWQDDYTGITYSQNAKVKNLYKNNYEVANMLAIWGNPSFTLPTPTKDGYTFLHWQNGGSTYAAGASLTLGANTTLTAVWKENKIKKVYGGNKQTLVYVANTECKAVYVGNTKVYG